MASCAAAESADVARAQMAQPKTRAQQEMGSLSETEAEGLSAMTLKPKSTDVNVRLVALVWCPFEADASGQLHPAWE